MQLTVFKTRFIANILMATFWILAVYSFVTQQTSEAFYDATWHHVQLAGDAVIIILGLWTMRKRIDIFLLIFYLVLSLSSMFLNHNGWIFWLNGTRHYICFVFILPIIRYLTDTPLRREFFIYLFDRALYLFLWIQVPAMIYQCILYGAYDKVGGTLGWMCSGVISTLIYLISFYLMLRRWDYSRSYMENLKKNWILIFLLFPSYLNETKISFIFLAMYFFFLVPMDRKFIKRIIIVLPIIGLALCGAGYMYLKLVAGGSLGVDDVFNKDFIQVYLEGDDEMVELIETFVADGADETNEGDYPRFAKFSVLPFVMDNYPHTEFVGFGAGQFKGGTFVPKSEMSQEYNWLVKGTQMQLMVVLLDLGWIGFIFVVLFMCVLFYKPRGSLRNIQLQTYLIIITIMTFLYTSSFMVMVFSIIFVYLGYISDNWQWCKELPPKGLSGEYISIESPELIEPSENKTSESTSATHEDRH